MSRVLPAGRLLRRMTAVAVLALLSPLTACSSASTAVEACMAKQATSVSSVDLVGAYAGEGGAKDVTVMLRSTDGKPGGTVTVRHWPTGDWYKSELGATFNGSGTWSVQSGSGSEGHARVQLSFTEPRTFLSGDTLDELSIATDGKKTYLYQDDDPDVCPTFRLRMRN